MRFTKKLSSIFIVGVLGVAVILLAAGFFVGHYFGSRMNAVNAGLVMQELELDYYAKVSEANAVHARIKVLKNNVPKELFVELKQKNRVVVKSGDQAVTYLSDKINFLDSWKVTNFLRVIERNRALIEQHNWFLEEVIEDYDVNNDVHVTANKLIKEYYDKLELVKEVTSIVNSLGVSSKKADYVEWRYRNNLMLDAGERLSVYLTEHFYNFSERDVAEILSVVTKNNERLERDNQWLEQIIAR